MSYKRDHPVNSSHQMNAIFPTATSASFAVPFALEDEDALKIFKA